MARLLGPELRRRPPRGLDPPPPPPARRRDHPATPPRRPGLRRRDSPGRRPDRRGHQAAGGRMIVKDPGRSALPVAQGRVIVSLQYSSLLIYPDAESQPHVRVSGYDTRGGPWRSALGNGPGL